MNLSCQEHANRCMTTSSSSTPEERFSTRVENYIRFRPGYPQEVVELLEKEAGLSSTSRIVDVGSGTGIFTKLLLDAGYQVTGVEPNAPMRLAAEELLSSYPAFTSIAAKAQDTTLPDASADLITSAQAFHWFATAETRAEFSRILKPGGYVALIWNVRKFDSTPFLKEYESLLIEYGTDYAVVRHEITEAEAIDGFFTSGYTLHSFPSYQEFDLPSLKGRLMSSSYTPAPGDPAHQPMLEKLENIFSRHQQDGKVIFEYDTRVYLGK